MGEKTIDVTINYKSDGLFRTWNKAYSRICPIDIKSFEGTDAPDHNWDKKAVEHLKIYL
jgi:hypothetical protein